MVTKRKFDSILTEQFLKEQHFELDKSPLQIAQEVGCDRQTIINYMRYFDIQHQKSKGRYRKLRTHGRWQGHEDISLTQFHNIRNNARIRNIAFEVTMKDLWDQYVSQNYKCALSGRSIGFVHSRKGNASLDRKDSSLPYTKSNIWWLHKDVNYAKQSLNVEEFIQLCREVSATTNQAETQV